MKIRPVSVSRNIVPVSEFKAKVADWFRIIGEQHQPVVITQNGKAVAVMLSPVDYDELTEQNRFVSAVKEGLDDLQGNRIIPHKELVSEMKQRYARPASATSTRGK